MWLDVRGRDIDVVVCDGVSASFDPDVASATAADEAGARLAESPDVGTAILAAKSKVAELARNGDPRREASNPACTIVAATVRGAEINVGWVGDSRAYWLPAEGPGSLASFGTRVLAYLVDAVAAAFIAGLFTAPQLPGLWSLVSFSAITIVTLVAFGQTPGMRLCGLRLAHPVEGGRLALRIRRRRARPRGCAGRERPRPG